jgi:hypothetical protein
MTTHFRKLNVDWNAEPNAPNPVVSITDDTLILEVFANPFVFERFRSGQRIRVVFSHAWRYRVGGTNDEGWYKGQCRFNRIAPAWGEFYEVAGDLKLEQVREKWNYVTTQPTANLRHFLFYLRDETFECDAEDWSLVE